MCSRFKLRFLVYSLLLVTTAASTAMSQSHMPRLDYRERSLTNGLKVYTVQDNSSPTVSIQVWYRVGSKDDPEGRSGFAHLFEHMMFKRTKNMKSETFDRMTEDVGGFNNASTWDDYTNYYEVVPSNYLEMLLWAEADRMSSLVVDEAVFKSERDVVKEEFRQKVLSNPYGRLFYNISRRSFTKHPYRRNGFGSIEDLDAATIEDVKGFHKTFYRPDNAVLIVVGDFEQAKLDAWIDKYLGRVPKPEGSVPRINSKEPERTAEQRFIEYAPNVPLPAVALNYLTPPASSADTAAFLVAEVILAQGESSRLNQSLVYQKELAVAAFATWDYRSGSYFREDPSPFTVIAVAAGGKKVEDCESALVAEIKRLQDQMIPADEIEKAKNQLITDQLKKWETADGKANAVGLATILMNDARRVNNTLEGLKAVTAADVQRVMKKYFAENQKVVIYYLPDSMRPAGEKGGAQ